MIVTSELQRAVLDEMWSAYSIDPQLSRSLVKERVPYDVSDEEIEAAERAIRLSLTWD